VVWMSYSGSAMSGVSWSRPVASGHDVTGG
jgi:hypothetical protein